jgi:predicted  nucleic acid-binding Zn-ribbon protein
MADEDAVVSYSVKELLANLDRKMDSVVGLLNSKADSAEVSALKVEFADMRQELADVRQELAEVRQREVAQEKHEGLSTDRRRWLIEIAAAFGLVIATAATSLLAAR